MNKDERIRIDLSKDKLQKHLSDLRETSAMYGLEARKTKDDESRKRAEADDEILKEIILLWQIIDKQRDQVNEKSETIRNLRFDIARLKLEIERLKKLH